MSYDAFISYSHSADGKLAPAVQQGLHQLAKPWNRRRALHIFRDDTGLSANPALWESIEKALDDSRFFLLFLSPTAAQSEWVGKEIARWRETKPASNLLPILTEGELVWNDSIGDFDPAVSTAFPAALAGFFTMEPRHLDLRWAKHEEQLDLGNSAFRSAIADLAAPIHGMAKEDLEGEDIRLQKRAKRLARTAVAGLVLLLLASLGAGALAVNSAREAADERDRAVAAESAVAAERDRAVAAEAQAQEERDAAEEERDRAQAAEEETAAALQQVVEAEGVAAEEALRAAEEALRANEEAERANEEAERANEEQVRAERAAMCDHYNDVIAIENIRFFPAGDLFETDIGIVVTDLNRWTLLERLWNSAYGVGFTGLDLVAVDALRHFELGPPPDPNDPDYLISTYPDPYLAAPYEWDYVGAEGPEGAYDYHRGFVSWDYPTALNELDFGIGQACRDAGLA